MAELKEAARMSETQRLMQLAQDKLQNDPGYKLAAALSYLPHFNGQGDGILFNNEFGHPLRAINVRSADGEALLIHDLERLSAILLIRRVEAESSFHYFAWPNTQERVYAADDTDAVTHIERFLGRNFPRTS